MVAVAEALEISPEQQSKLEVMARSHALPYRQVRQARALLWAGEGLANEETARRSGVSAKTVRRWRSRFAVEGVAGVGRIKPGRGRPQLIPDKIVEAIVHDTLHAHPDDGSTQWSTRAMAQRFGVGKDTVARIWRARSITPWRMESFELSNDSTSTTAATDDERRDRKCLQVERQRRRR